MKRIAIILVSILTLLSLSSCLNFKKTEEKEPPIPELDFETAAQRLNEKGYYTVYGSNDAALDLGEKTKLTTTEDNGRTEILNIVLCCDEEMARLRYEQAKEDLDYQKECARLYQEMVDCVGFFGLGLEYFALKEKNEADLKLLEERIIGYDGCYFWDGRIDTIEATK